MPQPERHFRIQDPKAKKRRHRRGAALYVYVMGVALLVSLLGMAGLTLARIERRSGQWFVDVAEAQVNAHAAVELALLDANNDPNWRTNYTHRTETSPLSFGRGNLSWAFVDNVDANLAVGDSDPVEIRGFGRAGEAVWCASATAVPSGQGLTCLEVALCGQGQMNIGGVITSAQIIGTNNSIDSWGTINADVEVVGSLWGTGYNGATTTGVTPRGMPNASVFDYYVANGTPIAIASFPKSGKVYTMQDAVITPTLNPYGATNAEGIYVIDCANNTLIIQYSRLQATLVLLNAKGVAVDFDVNWEAAVSNYPALLVQGPLDLRQVDHPLSEAERGVNFNPIAAPYEASEDSDLLDSYPAVIKGLIYASGALNVENDPNIEGVLIVGEGFSINSGSLRFNYNPIYLSDPPPGFASGKMNIVRGSWLRMSVP